MSGRKRGEVESVLRGLTAARQAQLQSYLRQYEQAWQDIQRLVAEGALAQAEALPPGPQRPTEADRQRLEQTHGRLKADWERWSASMEGLERQMRGRENDTNLRDQWYYDQEYAQAQELESGFGGIEGMAQQLSRDAEALRGRLRAATHARREQEERERLRAEATLPDLRQKMASLTLPHPLEPKRQLGLAECAREFLAQSDAYEALAGGAERLARLIDGRQYAEASALHARLNADCDALIGRVHQEYESLRKMVGTAVEIQETLADLGYRVDSAALGANLREGVRVFTTNTDRPLEFAVAQGGAEGEETLPDGRTRIRVAFNVDGLGGNCGGHAEELRRRLRHRGVDFAVTDWGQPPSSDPPVYDQEKKTHQTGQSG
ncbi:MAG: hypothetical protein EA420_16305 [Candidatus Competibacteraceae bacterium]|nr:MAG: hypothetical protein EA420_16305 [Candidatus Competibacteraceae bacterium]